MHRGLAAHYESRFRAFWLTNPPRQPQHIFEAYTKKWIEEKMPKYGIVGGTGVRPSTGIIARMQRKVPEENYVRMHPRRGSDDNPGV